MKTAFIPVLCALVGACGGGPPPLTGIGSSTGKAPVAIAGDTRPVLAQGIWRSQVDLDWVVQDKGTSYVDRSRIKLWFELEVAADQRFVLRVHWEAQTTGVLYGPYSPQRGRSAVQSHAMTDSWKGRIAPRGQEAQLLLDVGGKDLATQEFRCHWVRDDVIDYVHCAPMEPYTEMPSKDPLPAYLRTPLVFVPEGRLHARISGDHRGQSVAVTPD